MIRLFLLLMQPGTLTRLKRTAKGGLGWLLLPLCWFGRHAEPPFRVSLGLFAEYSDGSRRPVNSIPGMEISMSVVEHCPRCGATLPPEGGI